MSSSYTMLIPFLPMYLTMELGVSDADVNLWSGIVFSASFLVSAIMAPIWGRMADTKGKRIMAMRASFLLAISYFLGGIVETPGQLTLMRLFQGFASGLWPMDLAIMTLYAPPKKIGFCLGVMQGTLTSLPSSSRNRPSPRRPLQRRKCPRTMSLPGICLFCATCCSAARSCRWSS